MIDKNSKKLLKYFINHPHSISLFDLSSKFNKYSNLEIIDIINNLCKEHYVREIDMQTYIITNKGKTYKNLLIKEWLSKNIIAILALFVSVCALIKSC